MGVPRWWGVVGAALAAVSPLFADKTEIAINPGLPIITPEEAAIVADPVKGTQHAVILLEETDRDEAHGTGYELSYHLRAKILSQEGRALADVEIPVERSASELRKWWGRTILPDGKVLELTQHELSQQTMAKTSLEKRITMKGALPGVVPGAVIDYGYVIRGEGYFPYTRVELEQEWPVRAVRFRWAPSNYLPASFTSTHTEGRNVQVTPAPMSILVTAHDLQAVKKEPYMPPEGEVRAAVTFYYGSNEKLETYWDLEAKRAETRLKSFASGGAIKDAIAAMNLPADSPLPARLTAAYDWIGAHITNSYFKTAEEVDAVIEDDEDQANTAKAVLKAKEGTGRQLDYLFAAVARQLGADSAIIYAVDRTDRYWNRGWKSLAQFDYTFVGVRAPGDAEDAWTVVDPGSGLAYGEVPWDATGSTAFVCTPKGMKSFVLPPASNAKNRSDTHVSLSFSTDDEISAKWSRMALGASGMGSRRWLRRLDPTERKEQLDTLCGGRGAGEVSAADLPGLEEPGAPFQVSCDLTAGEANTEDVDDYRFSVMGTWWPETPELTSPTRVHAIVFDYPRLDIVSLDVAPPPGFSAKAPPPPVKVDSPFGKYQWVATKTDKGYHVDRAFALLPLFVKPADYDALKAFLKQVNTADRTALAFERTGGHP